MKKNTPVVICTDIHPARLSYVCDWVFNERLGISYYIITPLERESFQHVDLDYGNSSEGMRLTIRPSGWLDREARIPDDPALEWWQGIPVPVWHPTGENEWPDLFGAIFWALSRAEEYSPHADEHGRFPAEASWMGRNGILHIPWVDQLVRQLARYLELEDPHTGPAVRASLDIDDAYAFKGRGSRALTGLAADLIYGRFGLMKSRIRWLAGGQDPFDRYHLIDQWLGDIKKNTHIFFLLASRPSTLDHNLDPGSEAIRQLVRNWASGALPGIHPSYRSLENPELIRQEADTLSRITGRQVTSARFHFLRFRLPASYRALLGAGIGADHSMIYPDAPGYRAGTGHPFIWFDLEKDQPTELRVFPYLVMDRTMRQYLGWSPELAIQQIRQWQAESRANGTPFSWIWHNSTLGPVENWEEYVPVARSLMPEE